jgi:hydroxymethylpyrimidine/phosphomethylpyrimidine kinase
VDDTSGSRPDGALDTARYRGRVPDPSTPLPSTPLTSTPLTSTPHTALTIAGSDSGGGAGIQADLKTFAALGVHGTTALTALTAQNTAQVRGVVAMEADFVRLQIETVLDDFAVQSVKTGMLANRAIVDVVAGLAAAGRLPQLVVDPVLVSSSGQALMAPDGLEAYLARLLPHALVVTPNLREASALTGIDLVELMSVAAMTEAAEQIRAAGARYVVVKGGHFTDAAHDVVAGPEGVTVLEAVRVVTGNDHGTGCSLSAAISAQLARGADVLEAVRAAKSFVASGLAGAAGWRLGAGHGPIDHFGWSRGT